MPWQIYSCIAVFKFFLIFLLKKIEFDVYRVPPEIGVFLLKGGSNER